MRMTSAIWLVLLVLPIFSCSACFEDERISLLDFKQGLNFTFYREYNWSAPLESWRGLNCCAWEGVACHPRTAHVISLDLSYSGLSAYLVWSEIRGGLFQLLHLEHLDLSWNNFYPLSKVSIPPQFGELRRLKYLSLYGCGLLVQIPTELQQLEHLDLGGNHFSSLSIPPQVGELRRLKYLSLSYCGFIGQIPTELAKLQQLENLKLRYNYLEGVIPRELGNISTLKFLELSFNEGLQSSKFNDWITNLRGLEHLDLSYINLTMAGDTLLGSIASLTNLTTIYMPSCRISGEIPPSFANLSRLEWLDISSNSLRGNIPAFAGPLPLSHLYLSDNSLKGSLPSSLAGLSRLSSLDLSDNSLEGSIPSSLGALSKLQYLDLDSNKLNGSIPSNLGNLSALSVLYLQNNSLSGPIPNSIAKLSKLESLDIANNRLNGTFSFFILNNCPKLNVVDLSNNRLTVKVSTSTNPNFQLIKLVLRHCNIRGNFPMFISTQYLINYLDLSDNFLTGSIPSWLWEFTNLNHVDLCNNLFHGSMPKYIHLTFLSLAKNNLSGSIPNSILWERLSILDLSNNRFSGRIPQCPKNCFYLFTLNLEKNTLTGIIPSICDKMNSLEVLKVGDNALEGQVPSSLGECKNIKILDFRNNSLQGNISNWVESLYNLQILILNNNNFKGKIPLQLTKLQNLQILDMSNNNFSGVIPNDFMKLTAMANQTENTKTLEQFSSNSSIAKTRVSYIDEVIVKNKGQDLKYVNFLRLVKCLDLSSNNLSGNIPQNIGSLKGLVILNISRNHFSGEIPKSIGDMTLLESLDLSQNTLFGVIPTELQLLKSLSYFDVSYNKLSGMIPLGGQMMTFDSTYFSNNLNLCGLQIYVSCLSNPLDSPKAHEDSNEFSEDDMWWVIGVATGYVISFSIVLGMLWLNKTCSVTCFKFMDGIIVSLFQLIREKFYY